LGASNRARSRNDHGGKKKLETELTLYFPTKFNNLERKNIFVNRKKRILALCDNLLSGSDDEVADKIERYLLSLVKPKTFNGSGGYEIEFDKAYEELCHSLSSNANGRNVKQMTVKEVYILIDLTNKKSNQNGRG
jgi:hypothetical protein